MYYVITNDDLIGESFKTEEAAVEAATQWLKDECNEDCRAVVAKGIAVYQYEAKIHRKEL